MSIALFVYHRVCSDSGDTWHGTPTRGRSDSAVQQARVGKVQGQVTLFEKEGEPLQSDRFLEYSWL